MNRIALFSALSSVLIFSAIAGNSAAQTSAPNLDTVFKLMDSAAKDFHSLTADIEHIKYTAVVRDTATETGQISVRKDGKMRIDFKSPDPRTILRNGDSLYIYTPKISRVEEYNLGKNRAMADQYLALGFGTKSDTLKKTYEVSLIGEEEFDGKKIILLQLIPKSESVRAQLTKIQMWVDESSWLPLQQKFFETGSGDYFLSHYTNVMKNLKINDAKFKPNWPKDVKVEKPHG
ncbi:MAG TPA: outer membrane lipoprotein-sorting protein [Candidatus Dormibacteraeota bacterium]|nr:outer membrane lipoprotein-sorting protein [Candidatus Dormibacteraeota bacterium]